VCGPKSFAPGKKVALVCRVRKGEARDFRGSEKNYRE
jgi:hypothetical protein